MRAAEAKGSSQESNIVSNIALDIAFVLRSARADYDTITK